MKRAVAFTMAALMALTLVGCSSSGDGGEVDVEKDAEEAGTEWVDTVYEEEATETLSEMIADDEEEISELQEDIEDFETEDAFSTEDIEKLESNAEEEITELESDIEAMED